MFSRRYSMRAAVAALLVVAVALQLIPLLTEVPLGDFPAFYFAGTMARTGQLESLYDAAVRTEFYQKLSGDEANLTLLYVYPPAFAYLMVPFSLLPVGTAHRAWVVVQLLLLVGSLVVFTRKVLGRSWSGTLGATALATLAYPSINNQALAQSNAIILALAMIIMVGNSRVLRGLALGSALITKPFAGILAGAHLAQPVTIAYAAVASVGLVFIGGPANFLTFAHRLPSYARQNFDHLTFDSTLGVLRRCVPFGDVVFWLLLLAGVAFVALVAGRASDRRTPVLLALAALNALNPGLETHHFVLSIPPLIALWFVSKNPVVRILTIVSTLALFPTPYLVPIDIPWPAAHLAAAWSLFAAYALHAYQSVTSNRA